MKLAMLLFIAFSFGCSSNIKNTTNSSKLNNAKMICGLGYSMENGELTTTIEKMIDDKKLDPSSRDTIKLDYEACIKKQIALYE